MTHAGHSDPRRPVPPDQAAADLRHLEQVIDHGLSDAPGSWQFWALQRREYLRDLVKSTKGIPSCAQKSRPTPSFLSLLTA